MPVVEWGHDFEPYEQASDFELFRKTPSELAQKLKQLADRGEARDYLRRAFLDPRNIATVSYYEKWMVKKVQDIIEELVKEKEEESWAQGELPAGLAERYSEEELKQLLSSLFFVQPTQGCAHACPFCAWDAPKGVRSTIPFNQFAKLMEKYGDVFKDNCIDLHFASEPGDYKYTDPVSGKEYDYSDLLSVAKNFLSGTVNSFLTRRSDDEWLEYVVKEGGLRSLDNATNRRLQKQKTNGRGRGFKGVKHHAEGGDERLHTPGIGLSIKKTRNLVGKERGIYTRKPGSILTPRGYLHIFPGEIQDVSPQGLVAVAVGGLHRIEEAYEKLKPGVKLQDVMSGFAIYKMFDLKLLPDFKHAFVAYTGNSSDTGMVVVYSPTTYEITETHPFKMTLDEYKKNYQLLKNKYFEGYMKEPIWPGKYEEILPDMDYNLAIVKRFSDLSTDMGWLTIVQKYVREKTQEVHSIIFYRLNHVFKAYLLTVKPSFTSDVIDLNWLERQFLIFLGSDQFKKIEKEGFVRKNS